MSHLENGSGAARGWVSAAVFLCLPIASAASWNAGGAMPTKRADHVATLLADGKVLIAAGFAGGPLSSAARYDPSTNSWAEAASMSSPRTLCAAALMPNGRVIVAGAWQRTASAPAQAFSAAGEVELAVDGTTVDTTDGWRELRLAVFAERPAGSPATPAQWDSRKLPGPTARVAWAGGSSRPVVGLLVPSRLMPETVTAPNSSSPR